MLQARDQQRDGEDDLGSDDEVNLSWQGRFPFGHFQSGLVISTIQAKYTGISNLLSRSNKKSPSMFAIAPCQCIPSSASPSRRYLLEI